MRSQKNSNGVWIVGAIIFVAIWTVALVSTFLTVDETATKSYHDLYAWQQNDINSQQNHVNQNLPQITISQNNIAIEIPGIELQIPSPTPGEDRIQVVYANNTRLSTPSKGLVLILHACSHSALKFFSSSQSTCPDCVGLSEELRIVCIVLEMGYVPVAVSSVNRKNGCWGGRDYPRVEAVLEHELFRRYRQQQENGGGYHIFGIGASSGGAFAADLATRNIIEGALVMVMQLSNNVVNKIQTDPFPMYLAPMPRDKNRMKQVEQNYRDMDSVKEYVVLDRTTCDSLPVTPTYLVQRVPGMTIDAAKEMISQLKPGGHIDSSSNMLLIDPTKSDWRNIISPHNSTHWLGQFELKPGYSPLAKALHRAWAFHEYCSEAVVPALRFFEEHRGTTSS